MSASPEPQVQPTVRVTSESIKRKPDPPACYDTAKDVLSPDTYELLVEVRTKKANEPPKITKDFIAKNKEKI
jgi:hypothetical protein